MKVTKDGEGKLIIDLEGVAVDMSGVDDLYACSTTAASQLFNEDIVSKVINGNWYFDKNRKHIASKIGNSLVKFQSANLVIVDGIVEKDRMGKPERLAITDDYKTADLIIAYGVVIKDTVG